MDSREEQQDAQWAATANMIREALGDARSKAIALTHLETAELWFRRALEAVRARGEG